MHQRSVLFIFLFFGYSCFIMCQFLLYRKVTQSMKYVCVHIQYLYISLFTYLSIYVSIYFVSCYLPSWSSPEVWIEFPVLDSRTPLLIHSQCHSLHLLTPTSPPSPLPLSPIPPLATTSLFSTSFFSMGRFTCGSDGIPGIRDLLWCVSFSDGLTSLGMGISGGIPVAAHGMMSFFGWPSGIPRCMCTTCL